MAQTEFHWKEHPGWSPTVILQQQGHFSSKTQETKGIISPLDSTPAFSSSQVGHEWIYLQQEQRHVRWALDTQHCPETPAWLFLTAKHPQPQPPRPRGLPGKGEKPPLPREINGIITVCLITTICLAVGWWLLGELQGLAAPQRLCWLRLSNKRFFSFSFHFFSFFPWSHTWAGSLCSCPAPHKPQE